MAEGWARIGAASNAGSGTSPPGAAQAAGPSHKGEGNRARPLLALAYPDRIAKARGKPGEFLMANGRGAALEPHDRLAREPFLAVAEIAGGAAAARILAAAPIGAGGHRGASRASGSSTAEEVAFDRARAGAARPRGAPPRRARR